MEPVFRKKLVRSSVSDRFQLSLLKDFYDAHLPPHDHDNIVLVDEHEREYCLRYVVKAHKLQRGWRNFVLSNDLLEGDRVEFYPVDQCEFKFKVYIRRANRAKRTNKNVTVPAGLENPILKSCSKESLPANSRKRSPVTYFSGPKGKIRKMNSVVKVDCGSILSDLMNHSNGSIFNEPVDPVELKLPDYFEMIKEPMDLGTIKKKLEENEYSSMEKFAADVRLTFSNAKSYNPPVHKVYKWANHLTGLFDEKWKSLEEKLGPSSCNDDGQDSWQSTRESFQDNKKETQIGVDARTGKVNQVKIVKNQSNTNHKDPLSGRSSEHKVCSGSEMNRIKIEGDDDVVPKEKMKHVINLEIPHRSTAANGSDDDEKMLVSDCDSKPLTDQSHGVENSESATILKGFEDFKVHVNGETLDSEIPLPIRKKYYQLCCSQKKLIHVSKGADKTLVVPLIIQIVNIVDAIKVADTSTSLEKLEIMEKTLKFCLALGMAVGSLHAKLCSLIKFSKEHQTIDELTREKVAEKEKEKTAWHETNLKIYELVASAEASEKLTGHLEVEIKALEEEKEKLRSRFKEVAGLTW